MSIDLHFIWLVLVNKHVQVHSLKDVCMYCNHKSHVSNVYKHLGNYNNLLTQYESKHTGQSVLNRDCL